VRTAVIGKLSLEWPQAPFYGRLHEGNVDITYTLYLSVADDAMQTDLVTK